LWIKEKMATSGHPSIVAATCQSAATEQPNAAFGAPSILNSVLPYTSLTGRGVNTGVESASFDSYVQQRAGPLTRLAYLLTNDHHLAQDLTQETLARLHRHWAKVSAFDDPDAYVRRIMVNQLTSWRRRRSWSERTSADIDPHGIAEDPAVAGVERDAMWELLKALSPHQRAVIVLRFYEDLDDPTIASLLDCSPATVRSHASKALARLRSAANRTDLARGGSRG
jgi:RNA polymerase sigma-70 factor (sigma-E family)